jgi:ComF family protein
MERPPFAGVITYGLYSDTLKEAINLLKFSSVKRLAKPLGMLIAKLDIPQVDMIVPVPLSIKRLRQRGFNQTLLIGRVVSKTLDIPLSSELLYKKKETLPQAVLSASDRARNLKNAFATRSRLKGETVLLVDDVMTTGATARECSKTLLKAGAGKVFVATVARAVML